MKHKNWCHKIAAQREYKIENSRCTCGAESVKEPNNTAERVRFAPILRPPIPDPTCERCEKRHKANATHRNFVCTCECHQVAKWREKVAPASAVKEVCPQCKKGHNDTGHSGYPDKCFHCDTCSYDECAQDPAPASTAGSDWEREFDVLVGHYSDVWKNPAVVELPLKDFIRQQIKQAKLEGYDEGLSRGPQRIESDFDAGFAAGRLEVIKDVKKQVERKMELHKHDSIRSYTANYDEGCATCNTNKPLEQVLTHLEQLEKDND